MDKRLPLLAVFCVAAGVSFSALGGEFVTKTYPAGAYEGSRERRYQVYVPDGYRAGEPVPMVMVLHGCKQTEQNMINETRFRELADRDTFIVVYPFITSYDGLRNTNCWGFFLNQHTHEGAGEPEDLYRIGLSVESEFSIDPHRRYITGLSSGAGMSVVMAVAQSEYFAAAGAAAGLPYSETSSSVGFVCANAGTFRSVDAVVAAMQAEQRTPDEARVVPVMTVHSNNDCTVNRQGAVNIRDSWLRRYNAPLTPYETTDCTTEGVSCTHMKYGEPGRSVVETVFYEGERGGFTGQGSHYWVGDNGGEFANPNGPSASELFWDFFRRHAFAENPPPSVIITSATVEGRSVGISGSAADDSAVVRVTVVLEGRQGRFEQAASLDTTEPARVAWTVRFDDLPDNAVYTPLAAVQDDGGATASVTGERITVGTPPEPLPPTITIDQVLVNGNCVAVAGTAADADGTVTKVEVKLGTGSFAPATDFASGRYSYQACGLAGGRYTTESRATDDENLVTTVSGDEVEVDDLEVAVADWQSHLRANRLRVYGAPCANVGFGACDTDFATLFLRHSFSPFSLYRDPAMQDWYADPDNIPGAPVSENQNQPPTVAITELEVHDRNCVTLTGTAADDAAVAAVAVSLDGGGYAPVGLAGNAWPFTRCELSDGRHKARVRVQDEAGQETTATAEFMIGAVQPSTTQTVRFENLVPEQGYTKAACSGTGSTVGFFDSLYIGMGLDARENRAIVSFDTSGIPDEATVVAATLTLLHDGSRIGDVYVDKGPITADIKAGCFGAGCTVEAGDWGAAADASNAVVLESGNGQANQAATTGGKLDTAALGFVNKTGKTQFRVHIAPSACFGFGSYTGYRADDPKAAVLEVTYEK